MEKRTHIISTKNIKYATIIFCLFVIIYNPPLLSINVMHIIGAISWVYVLANRRMNVSNVCTLLIWVIVFLYLLIVTQIINNGTLSEILFPIYFIIDIIPLGYLIATYIQKKEDGLFLLWRLIITAAIIQSILVILSFTFRDLQMFFFERYIAYGYGTRDVLKEMTGYRMFGFASELSFTMPLVQCVVAIGCLYDIRIRFRIIKTLILAISALLNARSAIVVLIIGIVLVLYKSTIRGKIKILLIAISGVLLFLTVGMGFLEDNAYETYYWMKEALSDLSLMMKGDASGYYFTYLFNTRNYPMPNGIFQLFFGEGFRTMGALATRGVSSDIGYINDIYLGGIIYAGGIIAFFVHSISKLIKCGDIFFSFIGGYMICIFCVMNIKGPIFTMNSLSNLLFVIVVVINSFDRGGVFDGRPSHCDNSSI